MMMQLYPTSEDKRKFAEVVRRMNVKQAGEWLGLAACQDADTLDAYRVAHDEWKKAEPHPKDFAPLAEREAVEQQVAEWLLEARAEREAIRGPR